MPTQPSLLLYCQHSLGMGHLVRSYALADALSEHFRVCFLSGGQIPQVPARPARVEMIQLPPLTMGDAHSIVSRDSGTTLAAVRERRRCQILDTFERIRPAVVIVELFPFGRKKFVGELMPLLRRAKRADGAQPVVACSLRDLLVNDRRDQQRHDDRACWLANRYFDAILVHADPRFAKLDESFFPRKPLRTPVHYTGFVTPRRARVAVKQNVDRVLVSAGGGIAGADLFRVAVGAYDLLWSRRALPMTIVAGPFLPADDLAQLQRSARERDALSIVPSVQDLAAEMAHSYVSVSQCGYNTSLDIVAAGVPALVVPFVAPGEDEQTRRAERLGRAGAVRVLAPNRLDAATLAAEIETTLDFDPSSTRLELDGAVRTAQILRERTNAVA